MNITALNIYKYSLKLVKPVSIRGQLLDRRDGFILQIQSQGNIEGFGDVAPLPGFSMETFSQARDQLIFLKSKLGDHEIPGGLINFDGHFERWLKPFGLCSSVRFGIESAVLHLLANTRGCPVYKLIPASTNHTVRIAGLLTGTDEEITDQVKAMITEGFTEFKLKVGGNVDEDIVRVKAVNSIASGKALLHVDANQQWSYDEALYFGKEIGCAAVSYIEEPFAETQRIPEFFDATLIPVALDESLRNLTLELIRAIAGVETVIIKPTIMRTTGQVSGATQS